MSNVKISELPAASPLTGTESVPVVQGGQTRRSTAKAVLEQTVESFQFDTSLQGEPGTGQLIWNQDDGTLDLGLNGGDVVLQIGQEMLYRVKNDTGSQIADGKCVMAVGADGNSGRIRVGLTDGTSANNEIRVMGLATEDIPNGAFGFVTHFGAVRGIDTRGTSVGENWQEGDILYPHPTVAGALTNNEAAAVIKLPLAIILFRGANGSVFVRR